MPWAPWWLWAVSPAKLWIWISHRLATWSGTAYLWRRWRGRRWLWLRLLLVHLISLGVLAGIFLWLHPRGPAPAAE